MSRADDEDNRDTPPLPLSIEYRPVPGFPRHRVGSDCAVWFDTGERPPPWDKARWARLRPFPVSGAGRFVRLRHGGRDHIRSAELLRRAAFAPQPLNWLGRVGPKPPRARKGRLEAPLPLAAVDRPVPGFEGYRVGNDLTVWSCWARLGGGRGWAISDPPVWRPLKPSANGVVRLPKDGETIAFSLRRLSALVFPYAGEDGAERSPVPVPAPDADGVALVELADVVFRPVEGFPGYRVGSDRSIWSSWARWARRRAISDPLVWHRKAALLRRKGAPRVSLMRDGRQFLRSIEVLYRNAFPPPPPPVPLPIAVMHEPQIGSANGRAKLDEAKVAEARRLKAEGWTYPELVERYGVGKVAMYCAVAGRTWSHVPMNPEKEGPPAS